MIVTERGSAILVCIFSCVLGAFEGRAPRRTQALSRSTGHTGVQRIQMTSVTKLKPGSCMKHEVASDPMFYNIKEIRVRLPIAVPILFHMPTESNE